MPPPISLFSQSLFALPLMDAIPTTAQAGYTAIELACTAP
ncbi:MAG TPA: AP endonuclease, partial [Candidatus Latescibacteria bacterium]|nr:AP endonuclease [Candidatus Latescibacterota bacterium]